jgi:phytoene synthase
MTDLVPAPIAAGLASGQSNSNLAFALAFLPSDRRADALTFYRFCRIVDDIADTDDLDFLTKQRTLDAWIRALTDRPGALPADLRDLLERRDIDPQLLVAIVSGMTTDLHQTRYDTFEDLRSYCWRAASAVGLASIRIFGATQPASTTYAENLGLALQLTNILRDVKEDAGRDRIYLPAEDLYRFGVKESDILENRASKNFRELARFEADRASAYYSEAASALSPTDRTALRTAEIMRAIYERTLQKMCADNFQVFRKRYRLNRLQKLWIACTTR